MARLRCLLQLLLLTAAAFAYYESLEEWIECGIMKLCIVHKSCFVKTDKGWEVVENSGSYADGKRVVIPGLNVGACKRYITMKPLLDGTSMEIMMRDEGVDKSIGMKLYFKKKEGTSTHPNLFCHGNLIKKGEGDVGLDFTNDFKINGQEAQSLRVEHGVHCISKLMLQQGDDGKDIRERIQELSSKGQFEISSEAGHTTRDPVQQVNLAKLKIPCKDDQLRALGKSSLYSVNNEELAVKSDNQTEPIPINTEYGKEWIEEKQTLQCPPDYPMQYKKAKGIALHEYKWEYVKDGLICINGYMTHANDHSKKVDVGDQVKCAQRKCAVCSPPPNHYLAGTRAPNDEAPLYEPAIEGGRCRTLTCPTYMTVRMKDIYDNSPMMLHQNSISCSSKNKRLLKNGMVIKTRDWETAEDGERGELIDVQCTDGVYCTKMHPLVAGTCLGGKENKTCYAPYILDKEDTKTPPCPADFDLLYIENGTGNGMRLRVEEFKCNEHYGKWEAKNLRYESVKILDNSTLFCVRKEKETEETAEKFDPFAVGSVAFFVFTGGIILFVIAVIVFAYFYIQKTKQSKAAKRKAMESVSVTFKEPPKHKSRKDKKRSGDRKKKDADNSSRTGSKSVRGSGSKTPMTPMTTTPITTTPIDKGFSKPDKGCAVLNLKTGKSKELRWTNHTGDGPPSHNQEENCATPKSKTDQSTKSAAKSREAKSKRRSRKASSGNNSAKSARKGNRKRVVQWQDSENLMESSTFRQQ